MLYAIQYWQYEYRVNTNLVPLLLSSPGEPARDGAQGPLRLHVGPEHLAAGTAAQRAGGHGRASLHHYVARGGTFAYIYNDIYIYLHTHTLYIYIYIYVCVGATAQRAGGYGSARLHHHVARDGTFAHIEVYIHTHTHYAYIPSPSPRCARR